MSESRPLHDRPTRLAAIRTAWLLTYNAPAYLSDAGASSTLAMDPVRVVTDRLLA